MADTVTANLRLQLSVTQTVTGDNLSQSLKDTANFNGNDTLADGTIDDTFDIFHHRKETVTNESTTIDLSGNANLKDQFQGQQDYHTMKTWLFHNENTTPGEYCDVTLDTDDMDCTFRLHPNATMLLHSPTDGHPLTGGTNDSLILDTTGSGATAVIDVLLLGFQDPAL